MYKLIVSWLLVGSLGLHLISARLQLPICFRLAITGLTLGPVTMLMGLLILADKPKPPKLYNI